MFRVILVGGGHVHLGVLRALATQRLKARVLLINPGPCQIYSGMLPGWMAGHYSIFDCQIDLRPLAQAAGVELIFDRVECMDANRRRVLLGDGRYLDYDFLSLDVGSESNLSRLAALGKRLVPVKPVAEFTQRWSDILDLAARQAGFSLAVVGGGAAGVEIALAAQHVFAERGYRASVCLVASEAGVLPGHHHRVATRIKNTLIQRGIVLHQAYAVGVEDGLMLRNGLHLHADMVIAATGARPPHWLQWSQLAQDEYGYISVDATHRSLSHPNVFAAGDVCARTDTVMARSGVHAVFAGPVVAHNLIAGISGGKFKRYQPRKRSLYLLATGPKYAIVSWGSFSAAGRWAWNWKNWIDRRFMKKHGTGSV